MGEDTPLYNAKNILEVPLRFTFLTRIMKSRQNVILLSDGTIFFPILSKYWQVSKYTAFFPKIGKNKSKFRIVNLCNGGTKDSWSYGKLYIWKSELIFSLDKWNYSKLI